MFLTHPRNHKQATNIAVALAALQSYQRVGEFTVSEGDTIEFAGHTFAYRGTNVVESDRRIDRNARIEVDGGQVYEPSYQLYRASGRVIPTPSVRTGARWDLYLTVEPPGPPTDGGPIRIRIAVMPLALWLWVGGGLMVAGTVLALFPGRRRRPTDPVSAPAVASEELAGVSGA